jgi:PAS domain-containing protein
MRRASATGHQADATGSAPAPAAALLAAILETAEDGIVGLAPDRTIVFANQAAARYFGRPAADMVGERAEALFPADQRTRHRRSSGKGVPPMIRRLIVSLLLALVAGLIVKSLPDMARYLKIREM